MPHETNRSHRERWITRGLDAATLCALSSELPASQLWSLLLWVMEQRTARRTASAVQQQWTTDRFVKPCVIDQRILLALDTDLFATAEDFEAIELSPLAPLASCSAVALTTQNRTVTTVRGTEVVSDPTNVLALECAQRLRADPSQLVQLATSHRCVRAQPYPDLPGFAAHFRLFCLATAGHETADQALIVGSMSHHIRTHLAGLDRLEQRGYRFADRFLTLRSTPERAQIARRIAAAVPGIRVVHEPLTQPYYNGGLRFMINAGSVHGDGIPLIDGGAFDWVATLAANRKLVFVASCIGSQIAAFAFRPDLVSDTIPALPSTG